MSNRLARSDEQIFMMNIKVPKATVISRLLLKPYLTVPDVTPVKSMHTIRLQLAAIDRMPTITPFYPFF